MPEEGKLAAAVVAAAGSSTPSHESEEASLQQEQGDPEEVELDEERPLPPPPPLCDAAGCSHSPNQGRAPKPFVVAAAAAGAVAVDARRSSRGSSESTGNDAAVAAASASASAGAPERCPGRGFACSAQGAQQPTCSLTAVPVLHHGGVSGDDDHPRNEDGREKFVAAVSSRAEGGGAPPTVALWNAATSGVGAWGKAGGAGEGRSVGMTSQETVEVIDVGSSVMDVCYPGGGTDGDNGGGAHCGGRRGQERV